MKNPEFHQIAEVHVVYRDVVFFTSVKDKEKKNGWCLGNGFHSLLQPVNDHP